MFDFENNPFNDIESNNQTKKIEPEKKEETVVRSENATRNLTRNVTKQLINSHNKKVLIVPKLKPIKTRCIIASIILFILLISLVRVPYIGSVIDATVFHYLFGQAKYLIYLYGIILCILSFTRLDLRRKLYSKKFITFFILIVLGTSLLISGLNYIIVYFIKEANGDFSNSPYPHVSEAIKTFNQNWMDTCLLNFTNYGLFYGFVTGGFLSEVFITVTISWIDDLIYIILGILIIVIAVYIFINMFNFQVAYKFRKWLITKLGGEIVDNNISEVKTHKKDIKQEIISRREIERNADDYTNITPTLEFITDTSVDLFKKHQDFAKDISKLINKFFKRNHIVFRQDKTEFMPSFVEFNYEVQKNTDIEKILNRQNEFAQTIKCRDFNLHFKGNILKVEVELREYAKVGIRRTCDMLKSPNQLTIPFAINVSNMLEPIDLKTSPVNLIVGKNGSGSSMAQAEAIATLAYMNDPKFLEMIIITDKDDKTLNKFNALPHVIGSVINDSLDALNILNEAKTKMQQRIRKVDEVEARDIHEYNNLVDPNLRIPNLLISISNLEKFARENIQIIELISELSQNSDKSGIYLLLNARRIPSDFVNYKFYNNITTKIVLRTDAEYESQILMKSSRAMSLHGSGDAFIIKGNSKKRVQIANINQDDISHIVDIIKIFFEVRYH